MVATIVVAIGCAHESDLESATYDEYAKTQHAEIVDLVNASEIWVHFASEIDTSDRWFSFHISRDAFISLVEAVAAANQGPSDIEWADTAITPKAWHPRHSAPSWWKISPAKDFKSIAWCYSA
jgi:hypothetical protein